MDKLYFALITLIVFLGVVITVEVFTPVIHSIDLKETMSMSDSIILEKGIQPNG